MPEDGTAPITSVRARAYTIPTDAPESDGTIRWDRTTLVLAEVEAGGKIGIGFTYASPAAAKLINALLGPELIAHNAFQIERHWAAMNRTVRNIGRPGISATAISAVDIALWDLKAKLFDVPLSTLLPSARGRVPVYGSGGFTSYDEATLQAQLGGWASQGCRWVKMKVGRQPERDIARVKAARQAIGDTELFVDANGAYELKQSIAFAEQFARSGVTWFEEPVSSDDLAGLRLVREKAPPSMVIAAGEYGYTPYYFRAMLAAGAVDVLQADATRCGGISGFLRAAALSDAYLIPLSSHCAPSIHLAPSLAAPRFKHMEWFHDHVRIEHMLFEGAPQLHDGHAAPNNLPGHGLLFREADAARFED